MTSGPVNGGISWKRVEDLYHKARAKPPTERTRFLESACQGDAELLREVESLLASFEKDAALLEVPALEVAARILAQSPASAAKGPQPNFSDGSDLPGRLGIGEPFNTGVLHAVARKIFGRAPWWMYLLAAVFLFDCLLRIYCYVLGPHGFDFTLRGEGERPVIVASPPGSASDRGGIKPGDILLALDGQTIRECGGNVDTHQS